MRVICLSGAGLSADSGLLTFRGADGLYARMGGLSAEQFLSASSYARDPEAVERWREERRD